MSLVGELVRGPFSGDELGQSGEELFEELWLLIVEHEHGERHAEVGRELGIGGMPLAPRQLVPPLEDARAAGTLVGEGANDQHRNDLPVDGHRTSRSE